MASSGSKKEIRQRAPFWLGSLLFLNLVVMAIDARDKFTQQYVFKASIQTVASPVQRVTSRVGGSVANFIRQVGSFGSTARENERLAQQLADTELELRKAREAAAE